MQKFQNMVNWACFEPLFFNLIHQIQLCDKKNLLFVDCWDKNFIKFVLKNVIKLAKGSLNNIFQDSFNKILSQQLTYDRSYVCCFLRMKMIAFRHYIVFAVFMWLLFITV